MKVKALSALFSFLFFQHLVSAEESLYDLNLAELLNVQVESASLFLESNQKSAATVYRFDSEDWKLWGLRDNAEVLQSVAGVQAYHNIWGSNPIAIRGYAQFLSSRGIATLIDGESVNDIIYGSAQFGNEHITLGIVDTIELVKGPGSTLFGTDAFHGTLSFKSYQSDIDEFKLSAQLGNHDYRNVSLKASKTFENHIVNFAVEQQMMDGYQWPYQNIVSGAPDSRDNEIDNHSYSLKFHNGNASPFRYFISFLNNHYTGKGTLGGGENFGYVEEDTSSPDSELDLLLAKVQYQFNSGLDLGIKAAKSDIYRNGWFNVAAGTIQQSQHQEKDNIRLSLKQEYDDGQRFYAAYEQTQITIAKFETRTLNQQLLSIDNTFEAENGYRRDIDSAFIQGRVIGPWQVELEYGIRYDDYSDFGHHTTPRFGVILPIDDNRHILKLLYSSAFRAPVTAELFGTTAIRGNMAMKPEEMDSVELVYIRQSDQWQGTLILFESNWREGIVSVPLQADNEQGFTRAFINSGRNSAYGSELELIYLVDSHQLSGNFSYVRSRNDIVDQDFTAFPDISLNIQYQYQIDDQNLVKLRWSFRDRWSASSNADAKSLSAFNAVDISYRRKLNNNLSLTFVAKNVFNQRNRLPSLLGNALGEIDSPRQLDISFVYIM